MVVALPCIWGWKWYGDADSMLGCEMDGGPCVLSFLIGFMFFGWRDA